MKHGLKFFLTLTLCAALLAVPVLAAEETPSAVPVSGPPAPARVWGTVTRMESGSLLVKNSNEDDPLNEVVVHIGESTLVVDTDGMPLNPDTLKDGDTVYAWVGPAMTMSLPPQAAAQVIVGNIPQDKRVPEYYEIIGTDATVTPAIYPAPPRTHVNLPVAGGETLTIPVDAQFQPYLTRNIVTVDDLVPGSRVLVWRNSQNEITRVLLLPYGYRGYLTAHTSGTVSLNGEVLTAGSKVVDGATLLPLRAMAEKLGLEVSWESGRGAVISRNGTEVLSVLPGSSTVQLPEDETWELTSPCLLEGGVTYLPMRDLAFLLGLYLY